MLSEFNRCKELNTFICNLVNNLSTLKCLYFIAICTDPSPRNGLVNETGLANGRYRINSVVSFHCDTNYLLQGEHLASTCMSSGT